MKWADELLESHRKSAGFVPKYHTGGMVPNFGEQPAMLLGGEGVLNRDAVKAIGGKRGLNELNAGGFVPNFQEDKTKAGKDLVTAAHSTAYEKDYGRALKGQGKPETTFLGSSVPNWKEKIDAISKEMGLTREQAALARKLIQNQKHQVFGHTTKTYETRAAYMATPNVIAMQRSTALDLSKGGSADSNRGIMNEWVHFIQDRVLGGDFQKTERPDPWTPEHKGQFEERHVWEGADPAHKDYRKNIRTNVRTTKAKWKAMMEENEWEKKGGWIIDKSGEKIMRPSGSQDTETTARGYNVEAQSTYVSQLIAGRAYLAKQGKADGFVPNFEWPPKGLHHSSSDYFGEGAGLFDKVFGFALGMGEEADRLFAPILPQAYLDQRKRDQGERWTFTEQRAGQDAEGNPLAPAPASATPAPRVPIPRPAGAPSPATGINLTPGRAGRIALRGRGGVGAPSPGTRPFQFPQRTPGVMPSPARPSPVPPELHGPFMGFKSQAELDQARENARRINAAEAARKKAAADKAAADKAAKKAARTAAENAALEKAAAEKERQEIRSGAREHLVPEEDVVPWWEHFGEEPPAGAPRNPNLPQVDREEKERLEGEKFIEREKARQKAAADKKKAEVTRIESVGTYQGTRTGFASLPPGVNAQPGLTYTAFRDGKAVGILRVTKDGRVKPTGFIPGYKMQKGDVLRDMNAPQYQTSPTPRQPQRPRPSFGSPRSEGFVPNFFLKTEE
jgi:hypothetical protein